MSSRSVLAGAVAASALAIAGCGGTHGAHTMSSVHAAIGAPASGTTRAASGRPAQRARAAGHRARVAAGGASAHPSSTSPAGAGSTVVTTAGGVIVPVAHVTPSASRPLAVTRFASAADTICRAYRQHVASEGQATTLTAQERIYARVVDTATRAIASLRALSPPAGERATFTRYLQLTGTAIDDFVAAQRRSRSTQEAAGTQAEAQDFSSFQRVARDATAAGAVARQLRLRVCGSPGSDWL
jgi:hypothetical protein